MRRSRPILAAACLGAVLACAGSGTPPPAPGRTSLPTLGEGDTEARLGYETPPLLRAEDVLPPELRSGEHFRVADPVESDGFMHVYTIESDFGEYRAHGDDMLETRIAEVEALATLRDLSAGEEFAAALGRSLKSPFVAAWNLVTKPVSSISGVPRGAADELRSSAALSRDERGELEDSSLSEFFGFEQRKREIAARLGVDPYTSNAALQEELNRFAWVSTVGGFGEMIMPFQGRGNAPAGEVDILRDYAPEDLRRLNRIELAVMGIPEETSRAFVTHPWYSPRQQFVLVHHLAALDLVQNRQAFIEVAMQASSEEDAALYARAAELLHRYHENRASFERLAPFRDGTVVGITTDLRLVAPLPLDYAIWTRPAHAYANHMKRTTLGDGRVITGREVLLTGSLSPRARAKFEQRGIQVTERALEQLGPTEDEEASPADES